jgi:hypothetical protein
MNEDSKERQPITPDYAKMREFWEWFTKSVTEIEDVFADRAFLDALDEKVQGLNIVSWEIGPGLKAAGNRSLVLSPGGDRKLMELTTAMIDTAPDLAGWEFYAAKPPKAWDRRFSVSDEKGNEFEIDAADWSYCLLKHEEGFEIIIRAPNMEEAPLEIQQTAAEVLIEGEIGEAARVKHVDYITVVKDFEKELENKASPIRALRDHLSQLTFVLPGFGGRI